MVEDTPRREWTRVEIGEVITRVVDRRADAVADGLTRYIGVNDLDSDDLKVRRWGDVSDGQLPPTFRYAFPKAAILFPTRRPALRKCAVAPFAGITGEKVLVLRSLDAARLDPGFAPFLLSSDGVRRWVVDRAIGSVTPHFRWRDLAAYGFALPPLEEQRRIAEMFRQIDITLERHTQLMDKLRQVEASLFGALVDEHRPNMARLGGLLLESPRNGCSAPPTSEPTGHWVLGLSAVNFWGYRRGELKPVEKTEAMTRAVLSFGDLVVTRSNTQEFVGLPAVFDEHRNDVSWPDTMMRLTPDPERLDKRFLELFLRSPRGRQQVKSYAAGTSASMKKINATNVKKLLVPLLGWADQEEIVTHVSRVQDLVKASATRVSSLREIKRAALRHVFEPARQGGPL